MGVSPVPIIDERKIRSPDSFEWLVDQLGGEYGNSYGRDAHTTRILRLKLLSSPPMDGIFVIDKPTGITSARVVDRVRRATGIRKSGHAGTLDPAATGVLLVCQGRATKLVESMMDLSKAYETTARLDVTSESYDSDAELIPVDVANIPTESDVREAIGSFVGEIEQTPPAVSAVKIRGVPAYKRQRRGETVVVQPKRVTIYDLELTEFAWPNIAFRMNCGRGTYVRALIRDLGAKLNTGGCLTSLRRTRIGPFSTQQGLTLEDLQDDEKRHNRFIPIDLAKEQITGFKSHNESAT